MCDSETLEGGRLRHSNFGTLPSSTSMNDMTVNDMTLQKSATFERSDTQVPTQPSERPLNQGLRHSSRTRSQPQRLVYTRLGDCCCLGDGLPPQWFGERCGEEGAGLVTRQEHSSGDLCNNFHDVDTASGCLICGVGRDFGTVGAFL